MHGGSEADLIEAHVMAAARLHGDDTPVPVLARGKCVTGRAWAYVRNDRPFGGADSPAAMYTLIGTARLNDVNPQAWLADVLGRIADTPQSRLDELLPWNQVVKSRICWLNLEGCVSVELINLPAFRWPQWKDTPLWRRGYPDRCAPARPFRS